MRLLTIAAVLSLAACQSSPPPIGPAPTVPVLVQWPAGTRFAPVIAPGLPDEPRWRAVSVWWREALGQTVTFAPTATPTDDTPRLELTVDVGTRNLTASLREGARERVLGSISFGDANAADGSGDLLLAIDRLAWMVRLALGETPTTPMPVAAITSQNPAVVLAVDDADELLVTGALSSARRVLLEARRRDGGAPYVLERLAALELMLGSGDASARICREALGYSARTSPTTQHRLGRTLLMARAAQQPGQAEDLDRELLRLSLVATRERPHDDEVLWSLALAHNFRAEFAAARPLLEQLRQRLPERAVVHYHLGWACLALGEPSVAADHLAAAALRLPGHWVLLPQAIALYDAGRHDELERLFVDVLDEFDRGGNGTLTHQVQRMRAAHAILLGDRDRARTLLIADMRWLLAHPLALSQGVGEFAEQGAVLVRLGSDDELPALLAAIQQQHSGTPVADAAAFVAGMHQIAITGKPTTRLEQELSRGGDNAWALRLSAFGHERRGEVGDSQAQFARSALLSASPMTKALLASSLRAVGKVEEADRLQAVLRREMTTIHLRRSCQHPMFAPELAYAFTVR